MPGRDHTGPMGAGPRTGRGLGPCNGVQPTTFVGQGFGLRRGFARGGDGRGWRHRFFATGIPAWTSLAPVQEVADLKAQADLLKTQLDAVQKRIEELEAGS